MPPTNAKDSSSSCSLSFVDDDGCSDIEEFTEQEEENDDPGSQVTLSSVGTFDSIEFLTL